VLWVWGHSSVVEHLPSACEILGSTLSTEEKKKNNVVHSFSKPDKYLLGPESKLDCQVEYSKEILKLCVYHYLCGMTFHNSHVFILM
jgi:hypothetical protein